MDDERIVVNVGGTYKCDIGGPGNPILYTMTLEEMRQALASIGLEIIDGGRVIKVRVAGAT